MSPRGSLGLASRAKLEVVALVEHVLAQEVQRLAVALDGVTGVLGRVGLDPLAPAPEDVDLGAQLDAQVDGAHRLLQRRRRAPGVVGREGAVLEGRIGEQVGGRHGDDQPGVVSAFLKSRTIGRARRARRRWGPGRCRGS
jgi:hypothetical protein